MSDRKYTVRTVHIPTEGSTEGAPIRALVFTPTEEPSGIGALWIHGGGYIGGMPEMAYASRARDLVKTFGMTILAPDYRLAGQEPYPAALEDCYAVGDSENDLSMLSHVRHSIAMGNAEAAVKSACSYVTTPVGEDGIRNALAHFGLI